MVQAREAKSGFQRRGDMTVSRLVLNNFLITLKPLFWFFGEKWLRRRKNLAERGSQSPRRFVWGRRRLVGGSAAGSGDDRLQPEIK